MVEDIGLVEKLAELEHERWAHWMKYLFKRCVEEERYGKKDFFKTGNLVISAELVEHWKKQMDTEYSKLTQKEKESDREWARKAVRIIEEGRN